MTEQEIKAREIIKEIGEITYDLNRGGCLLACLVTFKKLRAMGYNCRDMQIIELNNYYTDHNKLWLQGKYRYADSACHFVLSFGNGYFDCDGDVDIHNWYGSQFNVTAEIPFYKIESFCKSALKYGDWNWRFNRRTEVKKIRKAFNLNIKYYE